MEGQHSLRYGLQYGLPAVDTEYVRIGLRKRRGWSVVRAASS